MATITRIAAPVAALAAGLVLLAAGPALAAPVQPGDPLALWAFEGNADDSAVGGHDGTIVGTTPLFVPGKFGQAIDINDPGGSSPYPPAVSWVEVPDFSYNSATGYSLSFWFKVSYSEDGNPGYWYRVLYQGSNPYDQAFYLGGTTNAEGFKSASGGDGRTFAGSSGRTAGTTSALNGEWHNVVAVVNITDLASSAGTITYYYDGAYDSTYTATGTYPSKVPVDPSGTLYFGRTNTNAYGSGDSFPGSLDEIAIWNTQLTAENVEWIWNGGTGNSLAIPEPATMALLAFGGLGMIGAGLRRRRRA